MDLSGKGEREEENTLIWWLIKLFPHCLQTLILCVIRYKIPLLRFEDKLQEIGNVQGT